MESKGEEESRSQVFVMAGGGSGERLMRALADAHIPFIAGALNIGDTDHTLALHLANEIITEQPYSPISPSTLEQIHKSLSNVKLLIVCPMPVGPGNLALLQEAYAAALRGIKVLLLAPVVTATNTNSEDQTIPENTHANDEILLQTGIAKRDYTNGDATKLVSDLLQAKATIVRSVAEAIEVAKTTIKLPHR
jgi:iron complex transport system ATP-binding protein